MISTFTSLSNVRALLGVSYKELADDVIDAGIFEVSLKAALRGGTPDLLALFETINAKASNTRTAAEVVYLEAMQIYAAYAVAQMLVPSLPQFLYKSETDSKAGFVRQDFSFAEVAAGIERGLASAMDRLLKAAEAATATPATEVVYFPGLLVSSPTINVVTGE